MMKKTEEITASRKVPRDSDNPIMEEYKEELLNRPSFGIHPATEGEVQLSHLEGMLAEMQKKLENMEKRIAAIEEKK